MITDVLQLAELKTGAIRIDAQFFVSAGQRAHRALEKARSEGVPFVPLSGPSGLGVAVAPKRLTRAYAVPDEPSMPYLQPYDVFEFMPSPRSHLSTLRNDVGLYTVEPGTLLQTCSGRNLGPCVIADEYLASFVHSHDLIRVSIDDQRMRHYVHAVISSPVGQAVLRRSKTGSVIDHLSVEHLDAFQVPLLEDSVIDEVSSHYSRAHGLRGEARLQLRDAIARVEAQVTQPEVRPLRHGWTVHSSGLINRIDAAYYDPNLQVRVRHLRDSVRLDEVAEPIKPAGRYKTMYLSKGHGTEILSGRQLLQFAPVGLKYIAPAAVGDPQRYRLHEGWLAFPADGRAEARLGTPVMVTHNRNGWLASGHVGRIVPKPGVDIGWLYAAMASSIVQEQMSAKVCGSVVDSLYAEDMGSILLPTCPGSFDRVRDAWWAFDAALSEERLGQEALGRALEPYASIDLIEGHSDPA